MFRSAFILTLAGALLSPTMLQAQRELPANRTYALTNARIVVAPGRVIDRGNVIVRNGRIAAVGPNASVPADARVLDLTGSTIYAGLIDAASGLGMPDARPAGQGPGGGAPTTFQQATQRANAEPSDLNADRSAVDAFTVRTDDLEAARAVGITAAHLLFEGGIFPGQTGVVLTGSTSRDSIVLRAPIVQQVGFGTRRGAYPSTLMGTLAYIEQAFRDADHLLQVKAAADRDPAAAPRVPHDEEARILGAAARRQMPVWFVVTRANDIRRARKLGDQLKLDYYIVGAQEGYQAVDQFDRARPVMVSLNYPRSTAVTGRGLELRVSPATGPDSAKIKADSAAALALRGNAAALFKAGIPIALTSYGLDRPRDFRDRIIASIAAGLPADEALRALTVTPARALGLERVLGTIETGKLANLVVTNGDLFSRNTRIRHVFVEGQKFDVPQQQQQQERERRN
jgi:imidazolonepropionase-like amidohydrolase